ncbi:MAG: divalent metal cation transporter [Bacteroidetes bacterium]|jgi:Mn2+/Fe2+ NRAMP family transporter|nr:divalent metal cation transporter [Bacteroidota bacterium]
MKKRFLNILFWSILSAAFIGPGTVTTAASAGAEFGYSLIWALIFSIIACYVLQETAARIYSASGINLGEVIQREYSESKWGKIVKGLVLISILTGCAALEAGNIVGAAAGISLLFDSIPHWIIVVGIGGIAGILLWRGTVQQNATLLGIVVAVMGFCFLMTAFLIPHNILQLLADGLTPTIPAGSELLVLGLIGTTVVPYNIFLGAGLKHTQNLSEMKISMFIAIGLGGLISITILMTGTAISGQFTFEALAIALSERLGNWAYTLLGVGLFGAGISSTLTAALAASITAQSLLSKPESKQIWGQQTLRFRSVWAIVLLIGIFFGLLNLQPVPVIILAQALNGIILPVIAVILFLMINNTAIISKEYQNRNVYNIVTAVVVYLTVLIGLTNLIRASFRVTHSEWLSPTTILLLSFIIFAFFMIPLGKNIFRSGS